MSGLKWNRVPVLRWWLLVPVAVGIGALGLMLGVGASQASSMRATGKLLVLRENPADDNRDWFVVNADGSAFRSLGSDGALALSPDGKWIALNYARHHLGMFVMRTNGSHTRAIKPFTRFSFPGYSDWSPDSRSIAIVNNKGLWTASLAHPQAHLIVPSKRPRGGGSDILRPAWSPTGSYIAFFVAKKDSGVRQWLYIVRPDGTGLRPIGGVILEPSPVSWAPDERSLVVSGVHLPTGAGREFLYEVKVKTGTRRFLGRGSFPVWAPQGQRILFTRTTGTSTRPRTRLLVMRSDGSGGRVLAHACGGACGSPAWSPDGTHIAFDSGDALVVIRADGTERRTLRQGKRVQMYILDWSR